MTTIWIVDTEDGETAYFSTKEKARKYADDWVSVVADEAKISLAEASDGVYIYEEKLDSYES